MKIAIVSPIFKTDDTADISNYRPISVLPCFSKILERVIYNCLHKYLKKYYTHNSLTLQKDQSTEHAIAQLVDQIYESFENEK